MALAMNRLQDILHLLPQKIHKNTEIIHQQVPGSLMKHFKPTLINNKAEFREDNLPVDSSIPVEQNPGSKYPQQHSSRAVNQVTTSEYSSNADIVEQTSRDNSWQRNSDNKYENALRLYLRKSVTRSFKNQNITEIDANSVADNIVQQCFEQCLDWGRETCTTPSVIIRFDTNYIFYEKASNINVYTYAYLACEREEPRFALLRGSTPKIEFEVTIELTGFAISPDKIYRLCEMLADHPVTDVIKFIETDNKFTWEDFDKTHSKPSIETKTSASRDELDKKGSKRSTETKSSPAWDDI